MRALSRLVSGRRSAWAVLVGTLVAVALLVLVLPAADGDAGAPGGLPDTSESAEVAALLAASPAADGTVGILVFTADEEPLDADQLAAVDARAAALAALSTTPQAVRPQVSDDGRTALVAVPLDAADVDADPTGTADELRAVAAADLPAGTVALLTGPVGFQDDVQGAFAGADLRLLLVTAGVVAVLLVVTYRSPVLWLVPLTVVGVADALAGRVAAAVAGALDVPLDASVSGILSVLVFGAGTNYALLLVARYREELTRRTDQRAALRTAVTSAGPAILASGGTVALSLLTLLLASLSGNRALGLACAVGVCVAMAFALVVLPAALAVSGRGLFWPFVPRVTGADRAGGASGAQGDGDGHGHGHGTTEGRTTAATRPRGWERLGRGVARRPGRVVVVSLLGLGVLATGLGGYQVGLSQTDQLLGDPDSVVAQRQLEESFPAGLSGSTTVLAPVAVAERAADLARGTEGVASATVGREDVAGYASIAVQLDAEPESDASGATVERLRDHYQDAGGPLAEALVGGTDAAALDGRVAAERDLLLLAPLILAVVLVVLVVLLRSLVAPLLLLASVLVTFAASLGASTWILEGLFGFPALDTSVTLYAFLFLVALGVDYNIFLTTRAREERLGLGDDGTVSGTRTPLGTREGMVRALSSTGAVITSAGVLLAAVFAVLGVLPVVALTQVGVIVCVGVLLDTLVVRTVLVPALVFLLGDRFWWPSRASGAVAGDAVDASGARDRTGRHV